jgi:hypothetical protein
MASGPVVSPPQKKGLSPIAWIGIGCLGILVIGGIIATVVTVFVARKVSQVAREMQEDPVAATAKLLAAANPDIELVSADKEARKVTFRDEKTGKELTFDYDDIEQGRVSFSSEGETAELQVESGEEGARALTVKTAEGTATFGAGGDAADIPSWVPVYPGVTPTGNYSAEGNGQRTGTFTFTTDADVDAVLDFYDGKAAEAGIETKSRTTTNEGGIWVASSADADRSLNVMISKGTNGLEILVSFSEKL